MVKIIVTSLTDDCNLSCRYCYFRKRKRYMSEETLRNVIEQGLSVSDGTIRFSWHGGEPLLAGLEFFEKVLEIQEELNGGRKIYNTLQTNGTLLNGENIKFFKENNIRVGISLDGPEEIHNSNRIYPDGNGSFEDVMESIELLKENKMNVGCVCVLTRNSIDRIEQLYKFFRENVDRVRINPIKPYCNPKDLAITPEEYGRAMIELFDMWYPEPEKLLLKNLYEFAHGMAHGSPIGCSNIKDCHDYLLGIDPDGNVYPCDNFYEETSTNLGNLNATNLQEILKSDYYSKFRRHPIKDCKGCDWNKICNGGCAYCAYKGNASFQSRDYYCEGRKMIFDHLSERLGIRPPT